MVVRHTAHRGMGIHSLRNLASEVADGVLKIPALKDCHIPNYIIYTSVPSHCLSWLHKWRHREGGGVGVGGWGGCR